MWAFPSPHGPEQEGTEASAEIDLGQMQLSEKRRGKQRKPSTEGPADESWQGRTVPGNNRLKIINYNIYMAHLHLVLVKLPRRRKIMTDAK